MAAGHYRNGILLTPATATLVADIVEGKASGPRAFSPKRVHDASQTLAK